MYIMYIFYIWKFIVIENVNLFLILIVIGRYGFKIFFSLGKIYVSIMN